MSSANRCDTFTALHVPSGRLIARKRIWSPLKTRGEWFVKSWFCKQPPAMFSRGNFLLLRLLFIKMSPIFGGALRSSTFSRTHIFLPFTDTFWVFEMWGFPVRMQLHFRWLSSSWSYAPIYCNLLSPWLCCSNDAATLKTSIYYLTKSLLRSQKLAVFAFSWLCDLLYVTCV